MEQRPGILSQCKKKKKTWGTGRGENNHDVR